MRPPYRDPVDQIWLQTLAKVGWRVERSDQVFASWDGESVLRVSTPQGFDPDDSMAQMLLHELCHALVEGPERTHLSDFGLENIDERHLVNEHACHRLQAALLDPHGLREMLAPTTDHRPYYDALPKRPLAPCSDPALPMALVAYRRATQGPWAELLQEALQATAAIAKVMRGFPGDLWGLALEPHPTGLPPTREPRACGECAWSSAQRCLLSDSPCPTLGCLYWEPKLSEADCQSCGACCRQGFDVVDIEPTCPLLETHGSWVVDHGFGPQLPRPGGYCVGLEDARAPYRCSVYPSRPRSCRDLAPGSAGCMSARQRAGVFFDPEQSGSTPASTLTG